MNVPDPANTPSAPAVTAEGEAFPSEPARLQYLEVPIPGPGQSVPIAPGVRWARIPLPIDLNHINVWLVETGDGCVVIDTGMSAQIGKDAWENIERDYLPQRPLRAVFVTHNHPDHIGLAKWLQERFSVPVLTSRRTNETAQSWGSSPEALAGESERFFKSHGLTDEVQIRAIFRPDRFARITSGMPRVDQFVADEDVLRWGASEWTALETNGHAEGHLCLSNPGLRVLISGDQVLPTISSNISFMFHRTSDPNPLGSYLSSLQRLRALHEETLVLPAHGRPFRGLRQRIDDLTAHHMEQLDKLAALCAQPRVAAEVLPFMFRRELKDMHLFLALGEALAHLEYLVHAGRVRRELRDGRVNYIAL